MICPLKNLGHLVNPDTNRIYSADCSLDCALWNPKGNFNPETKQFEGECCIKTLSNLKISGGVSCHAY